MPDPALVPTWRLLQASCSEHCVLPSQVAPASYQISPRSLGNEAWATALTGFPATSQRWCHLPSPSAHLEGLEPLPARLLVRQSLVVCKGRRVPTVPAAQTIVHSWIPLGRHSNLEHATLPGDTGFRTGHGAERSHPASSRTVGGTIVPVDNPQLTRLREVRDDQ